MVLDPYVGYNECYHGRKSLPHHDYHRSGLYALEDGIAAIKDRYFEWWYLTMPRRRQGCLGHIVPHLKCLASVIHSVRYNERMKDVLKAQLN